jgi:hypothetical protein
MGSFGIGSGDVGTFSVEPGETARLDGTTAWIELGPLTSDLRPGSVVAGRLVLGHYEAPLTIHVSPSAAQNAQHEDAALVAHEVTRVGQRNWFRTIPC